MWPTEQEWRATVPQRLRRVLDRWQLTPGRPIDGGSVSHVLDVTTADGRSAVLKLSFPHREAEHEAAALRRWDGHGAVRLLDVDPDDPFVLLLERCVPGVRLVDRDDLPAAERLAIAATLLTGLWDRGGPSEPSGSSSPSAPSGPFERVADVTAEWADLVEERARRFAPGFDEGLVRRAAELLRVLPGSARRYVVVHGDANPGNVLAAERSPWLVIDPKPMIGDPAYDLSPLVVQVDDPFRHGDPARVFGERLALLADVTGEPTDRIAAWCTARLVEAALWSVSRGAPGDGADARARAALTDRLAG
ncbi:aminoglycoside phosphotransferase family protein [Curtobacterium flaccumfaciens pv. beticola]|uniref:aminoglycoside phosphotransferase family protein n=1 Tax=Curtobacterium flaccumfaciens TaxID=2035 RepID=UPI00349F4955|nr:aminoglycoside phosphotransferase family protein [Curtobacterium flaccumfaciens pv. basellae]